MDKKCIFCQRADNNEARYGKKLSTFVEGNEKKELEEIVVHHFCLLFSAGICSRGMISDGILGFLPEDIKKEVSRGSFLRCHFCSKQGATAGCCVRECNFTYHPSCGFDATFDRNKDNWIQFQFQDEYQSWCKKHSQTIPFIKTPGHSKNFPRSFKCQYCFGQISRRWVKEIPVQLIQCRCCKTYCHTDCVRHYAYRSGETRFKCCFCNCFLIIDEKDEKQVKKRQKCKNDYMKNVQRKGVYVPKEANEIMQVF